LGDDDTWRQRHQPEGRKLRHLGSTPDSHWMVLMIQQKPSEKKKKHEENLSYYYYYYFTTSLKDD
jgi:hypothetical protein